MQIKKKQGIDLLVMNTDWSLNFNKRVQEIIKACINYLHSGG